ncbi:MAG: cell division protein FtsQ [Cyclobacteriaceae bacterium]|nr:cell division protein FtsQ [Cyclobacteriaceae bacterium]
MKLKLKKIWPIAKVAGLVIIIFGSIGFVEKQYDNRICTSIKVDIDNQFENYFINESDVIDLITRGGDHRIVGESFDYLNLKGIEIELLKTKFIREAEVYKDLEGNLMISIDQSRPIARMMSRKMKDRYISNNGEVLPLSKRYTARVMLIDGAFADNAKLYNLNETEMGRQLMELLKFIEKDKFWKAQIAWMNIDKKGNITMYTQVSKQVVEFGKPVDIREKFRKLKIFYKDILPTKGWNSYNRVSVKFKDQIVCE